MPPQRHRSSRGKNIFLSAFVAAFFSLSLIASSILIQSFSFVNGTVSTSNNPITMTYNIATPFLHPFYLSLISSHKTHQTSTIPFLSSSNSTEKTSTATNTPLSANEVPFTQTQLPAYNTNQAPTTQFSSPGKSIENMPTQTTSDTHLSPLIKMHPEPPLGPPTNPNSPNNTPLITNSRNEKPFSATALPVELTFIINVIGGPDKPQDFRVCVNDFPSNPEDKVFGYCSHPSIDELKFTIPAGRVIIYVNPPLTSEDGSQRVYHLVLGPGSSDYGCTPDTISSGGMLRFNYVSPNQQITCIGDEYSN